MSGSRLSGRGCDIAVYGMTSHNFLILSAKSKSVLDLICNRFAAELNHWFGPSQAAAFPQFYQDPRERVLPESLNLHFCSVLQYSKLIEPFD